MSETVLYKNDAVKKLKKRAKVRREIIGTLMIAAPLIGFIAFTLFPMVISFIVSFHDLHSYNMKYMEYCGWDNYKKIFAIGIYRCRFLCGNRLKTRCCFRCAFPSIWLRRCFLRISSRKNCPGINLCALYCLFRRCVPALPLLWCGNGYSKIISAF